MKRSSPLRLERLEDRTNPSSLTVSFVPDGTQVGMQASELSQDNAGIAPAVWQQQLLSELQTAISAASQTSVTLTLVPDDGASMNAPAPQDGALRIAAVDQLFASDGTVVSPAAGTDFMVGGGSAISTFGIGLGLVGPNGQPLSPAPTPPGTMTSGSMLPFIMPVQKAYGNLYPTAPANPAPTTPPASPPSTTNPAPTTPSSSVPSITSPTLPGATTTTDPTTSTDPTTTDPLSGDPSSP